MDTDPAEALQLVSAIQRLSEPLGFVRGKLASSAQVDRLWSAWIAPEFPGCEDELFELIDDETEVGEAAADALLKLCPERCADHPRLSDLQRRDKNMDVLQMKLQWDIRGIAPEAESMFRSGRYKEFLLIVDPYLPALSAAMQRKASFARNRAEQDAALGVKPSE